MRQVGRSVQCRQNRRGRTAATWPYSTIDIETDAAEKARVGARTASGGRPLRLSIEQRQAGTLCNRSSVSHGTSPSLVSSTAAHPTAGKLPHKLETSS